MSRYPELNPKGIMEMDKISDMNALYAAYMASMRGSAWKEEPQKFEIDFLSEITELHIELEGRTYRTLEGNEFILRERGKTRYIHGSRMRDRVVRHSLCDNVLTPELKPYLIYNNGSSQKGKGLSFARRMFERDLHNYWLEHRTNEGYIGFADISKFYDNIRHDLVKELVYPKIDESAHWLMDEIMKTFEVDVSYMTNEEYASCMELKFDSIRYNELVPREMRTGKKMMKKSVNIGDQVSQNLGIYFPTRLDNYAKIVRGCKRYGRYSDDIYVIGESKEYVMSVLEGIQKEAEGIGLFINEKKTHVAKLSDTYRYLQVKYSLSGTGKVIKRINPESVTRERRRIKAYKRLVDKGIMTYDDASQAISSWMGSYVSLMSKQQLENFRTLYRELFGKELRWKKQH
jgi:hypothetical protein